MDRRGVITTAALTLLGMELSLPANAQSLKQQVVGNWTLTSGTERLPNGTMVTPWVAGNLILDPNGHFSLFLIGKDRPKTKRNPRVPIGPFVAFYGTYAVDEATKTMTYNVEFGASPTFDNQVSKQTCTVEGDVMTTKGTPVKTPQGEITPVNEWKRTK
jgi:hypothetical protein